MGEKESLCKSTMKRRMQLIEHLMRHRGSTKTIMEKNTNREMSMTSTSAKQLVAANYLNDVGVTVRKMSEKIIREQI